MKRLLRKSRFIKRYMGGNDFLKNNVRYCLWINENEIDEAKTNPFIFRRINKCREYRVNAGRDAKKVADKPYRFCYRTHQNKTAIIFPKTTSSGRKYVPVGITNESTVINVDAFAIYDIEIYLLGLLSSNLHNIWLSISSGKLGAGYRYSVKLSYNTFPFPPISIQRKKELTQTAFRILEEREKHPEKTLAQLYDPIKMPEGLIEAHRTNDLAIERCYRSKPFENDEERLEYLFKLYEKMLTEEKEQSTLLQ